MSITISREHVCCKQSLFSTCRDGLDAETCPTLAQCVPQLHRIYVCVRVSRFFAHNSALNALILKPVP